MHDFSPLHSVGDNLLETRLETIMRPASPRFCNREVVMLSYDHFIASKVPPEYGQASTERASGSTSGGPTSEKAVTFGKWRAGAH